MASPNLIASADVGVVLSEDEGWFKRLLLKLRFAPRDNIMLWMLVPVIAAYEPQSLERQFRDGGSSPP